MLGAALVVTALAAWWLQGRNGRFASTEPRARLSAERIGAPLGDDVTFVQFSTAFCTPCRATRALLADIAERTPGVAHVEIDAESHLDLVRELDIMRTPTVLVLDADGVVRHRASGAPTREQVSAVLARL